jgi:DNA replication protein DnaC
MMVAIKTLGSRGPALDRIPMPCGICGAEVMTYPGIREVTCSYEKCRRVRDQWARRREVIQLLADLPEKLPRILKNRGMGPGELESTRSDATPKLRDLCAPWADDLLAHPEAPSQGFGLLGGAGIGKTGLVAAVTKEWARVSGEFYIKTWGVNSPSRWAPLWANWESKLSEIRGTFGDLLRHGDLLDDLKETPLLVLEDLGAEQATENSWANTLLYEILEARYKAQRAILWTSNLSKVELQSRYGSRLMSRLMGMAPALEVSADLPDRRFEAARVRMSHHKISPLVIASS